MNTQQPTFATKQILSKRRLSRGSWRENVPVTEKKQHGTCAKSEKMVMTLALRIRQPPPKQVEQIPKRIPYLPNEILFQIIKYACQFDGGLRIGLKTNKNDPNAPKKMVLFQKPNSPRCRLLHVCRTFRYVINNDNFLLKMNDVQICNRESLEKFLRVMPYRSIRSLRSLEVNLSDLMNSQVTCKQFSKSFQDPTARGGLDILKVNLNEAPYTWWRQGALKQWLLSTTSLYESLMRCTVAKRVKVVYDDVWPGKNQLVYVYTANGRNAFISARSLQVLRGDILKFERGLNQMTMTQPPQQKLTS